MRPQKSFKKIVIVVAVLVLVSGTIVGSYLILQSRISQANLLEQMAQRIQDKKIIDDLDHDGLNGWEENIHGTNPENPDTDGDGYLDGEEVIAGYDPTIPAPNDKLDDDSSGNQAIRPQPGNLTQTLSYILANQMKFDPVLVNSRDSESFERSLTAAMDEKIINALQKASANFIYEFIPTFEKEQYQFKTTPDNNLAAIRNYSKEASDRIGNLESCSDPNNLKNDAEIINESIQYNDFSMSYCLTNSYLQIYQKMLDIPVPLDWLDIHRKFLTVYWNYHKIYQHLPTYENDPLKGLLVVEKFKETSEKFSQLLNEMQNDLESRQQ